jgi:hypothetical protein
MSFVDRNLVPTPLQRLLRSVDIGMVALAARWRGIVLVFLIVLTAWLAAEVFSAGRGAVMFLHDNLPKMNERYKQYLPITPRSSAATPTPTATPPVVAARTTICWRDRSLGGSCFKPRAPGRAPPVYRGRDSALAPSDQRAPR